MNVSTLYNNSSVLSLSQLYGTDSVDSTSSDSIDLTAIGLSSTNQSDSVDISKPGQLYAKLQELAQSDPDKLKEVCSKIAEKLKSAAEDSSGGDSKMLSDLAEKFENVANGGDVSQLKPPAPPSTPSGGQDPIGAYSKQKDDSLVQQLMKKRDDDDSKTDIASIIESALQQVTQSAA